MNENDTEEHLSSRQSYRARQEHRLAQSFETMTKATERARTTPPKVRERCHAPSTDNIIGDLDQLLIAELRRAKVKENGSSSSRENLVMTSAYGRTGERANVSPSVQTLNEGEGAYY